ncbi:site-specific integrase [Lihuaxuella thermophila]|uniref:Site-specific recombinase XerD n=1 Tax=Lihuaxuella thermophila TaxID=1173111 RepID=A0A1H8FGY2_9BACL|nr:site-specific integrase [Lihuaxuella thermophila]SEN30886.1 Site-specific recombinase XerD [Lihuaxuella thermophila]
MSKIEIVKNSHTLPVIQSELSEDAKEFIQSSQSENTRRAYRFDLRDFDNYLKERGIRGIQVTGTVIANYLSYLAKRGFKVSTIQRRLVAIRALYDRYGSRLIEEAKQRGEHFEYHNPANSLVVRETMKGISRTLGVAPKQKRAATKEIVESLFKEMGQELKDIRDQAIISLGFSGAFRRSELVALNAEDIKDDTDGIWVHLKRSKTDQEGRGMDKFIYYGEKASTCPVRLLKRWLKEAKITEGAVFRRFYRGGKIGGRISDKTVAEILKKAAENAGFDKDEFAGHSLRRGFITTAAKMGIEERVIMRHTGHKSIQIMRRYIEEADVKKNNPTKGLW